MNAGHANEAIIRPAFEQAMQLQHTTSIYLTEPVVQLAAELARLTPGALSHSFFCASGSEANEAALLMAKLHTGRSEFIALDLGLHGRTRQAMSATGLPIWRTDPQPLENVHFAEAPRDASEDERALAGMQRLIDAVGAARIAAVILEPVLGSGGIIPLSPAYLRGVRALTQQHGILLIADEMQTGFGRTGSLFGVDEAGITPDLMTFAKALGNGFPIAAVIATPEVAAAYHRPGASTFGGNPMCCAAALATLTYHREHNLAGRAQALGAMLQERLAPLAELPNVAAVRGRGLMWGIELCTAQGEPDAAGCGALLELAKDEGFLIGRAGRERNVLMLAPPLVVEEAALASLADFLAGVLHTGAITHPGAAR